MRLIQLIVLVLFYTSIFGQVLKVEVRDAKTGDPVQNVSVVAYSETYDSNVTFMTNGRGIVILGKKISSLHDSVIVIRELSKYRNLEFSHPIYQNQKKDIANIYASSGLDTILLNIFLQPIKQRELREVRLSAPGKVDTVYGSQKLGVLDFEIFSGGNILLLLYPRTKDKATEISYYRDTSIVNSLTLSSPINQLVRDYRGNVHAVGVDFVHGIQLVDDSIQTAQVPLEYYVKYLAPIIDTTISKVYVTNYNPLYPAFEYYALDKKDSTYTMVTNVRDDLMMTLYRSEYKWVDVRTKLWAKEKEIETGIDAEIWVGANYFTQSIYWEEIYAPLFERNDSIFVFNYPKDLLEVFDDEGNQLIKTPIFHHYQRSKTGFKRKLIQDYMTGAIYAVYERAGISYLGLLNISTGEISEKAKLNFKYIDQIKVYNNEVYYVYRPFESAQKRYLYKERLPYNFGKAKVNQGTKMSIETGK